MLPCLNITFGQSKTISMKYKYTFIYCTLYILVFIPDVCFNIRLTQTYVHIDGQNMLEMNHQPSSEKIKIKK